MTDTNTAAPPEGNRRRTERVRVELPIRVNVTSKGTLIDLSEGGALVLSSRPYEQGNQVTLAIDAKTETVHLAARVVRCTPQNGGPTPPSLDREGYQVALEFLPLQQGTAAALRRMLGQDEGRTVLWRRP